jgi:protein SCO1/2
MKIRTLFTTFFLVGTLVACQQTAPPASPFHATDITGADFGRGFELSDHNGQTRKLTDFRGKVVALFFGYTHCPDVCPTTLSDFALALKKLGADANRVQVLFITLDPERDTLELLKHYVPAFNPAFLGLRPNAGQLKALASEYKVVYQKTPGGDTAEYGIDHSANTYIYDRQGRLRLLMPYASGVDTIADDLKALLR